MCKTQRELTLEDPTAYCPALRAPDSSMAFTAAFKSLIPGAITRYL